MYFRLSKPKSGLTSHSRLLSGVAWLNSSDLLLDPDFNFATESRATGRILLRMDWSPLADVSKIRLALGVQSVYCWADRNALIIEPDEALSAGWLYSAHVSNDGDHVHLDLQAPAIRAALSLDFIAAPESPIPRSWVDFYAGAGFEEDRGSSRFTEKRLVDAWRAPLHPRV